MEEQKNMPQENGIPPQMNSGEGQEMPPQMNPGGGQGVPPQMNPGGGRGVPSQMNPGMAPPQMNPGGGWGVPPQMNQGYGMPYYGYAGQGRTDSNGMGIASMILGIISLLLFCTCINWITAILAIIFGIIQLTRGKEKGFAVAGIVTAAISLVFSLVLYGCLAAGMSRAGLSYDDFYDSYYDSYYDDYYNDYYDYYNDYYDDYDDYYNDDYYDDYFDDYYNNYDSYYDYEESGQEFLIF